MRSRLIKSEFFASRSLARVSIPAMITFTGLWADADSAGRGVADPRLLKGHIWPLRDDITPDDIASHLDELAREHIVLYAVNGDAYYAVKNWEKHQSAAYRTGSAVHPEPPNDALCTPSPATCTPSPALREVKGREVVAPPAATRLPESAAPAVKAAPGKRARDPLWDALTEAIGEAATRTEQSNRGRTVSELKAAGATPDEIAARCSEYRRRYQNMALTDAALRKHWSDLTPQSRPKQNGVVAHGVFVTGANAV